MDAQQLGAVLLVIAFVVVAFTVVAGVPGLYAMRDIEYRLERINAYRTRWLVAQWSVAAYAVMTAAGYLAIATSLEATAWAIAGAVLVAAGSVSGVYFVYLQTVDPRGGYSGAYPRPEVGAYWLWLGGQLLVGIALLLSPVPVWLGLLTAGSAVAYAVFYLVSGVGFLVPFVAALIQLVIGLVLLLQQ